MRAIHKPSSFILPYQGVYFVEWMNLWTRDFILAYNLSRKNELNISWVKKRVEADAHMMQEY